MNKITEVVFNKTRKNVDNFLLLGLNILINLFHNTC